MLESEYEGDEGHPRIGEIQREFPAYELLVTGDLVLTINGTAVKNHKDSSQLLREAEGEVVMKLLAKEPRKQRSKSLFGTRGFAE